MLEQTRQLQDQTALVIDSIKKSKDQTIASAQGKGGGKNAIKNNPENEWA
ncbi:MAG: hypothetical protein U5L00_16310 [Desulfovermiculus sp.]|nr:hypothetical protein [Desulfovermiculus sp.]